MRLTPRYTLLVLLLGALLFAPTQYSVQAAPAHQDTAQQASFRSLQAVVAPLQPATVNVNIPGYSGSAALIIFDSKGRSVGSWDVTVQPGGHATLQVEPRGSPGDHWAALFVNGAQVASGIIYRLDAQTTIQTGVEFLDALYPQVHDFMQQCILEYPLQGHTVHGYRSPDSPLLWLRDHYYQGRGFKYFEPDMTSLLDAYRREQQPNGSFPDFLARPSYNIPAHRTPVEADVEYLFVQAVYEAWKVTGNDEWMRQNIPAMQKAVSYSLNHPLRWDANLGLVKRPFTIDTWDFEYGPTTVDPTTGRYSPRHWIDDKTKWGIFHGDNTGLAAALRSLAHMEEHLGMWDSASEHRQTADAIMKRLNALSWNGSFYTHHVKLTPWDVPGVDESTQLSLSNTYALNRGVLTNEQAQAIINEYRTRFQRPGNIAFAEWWSINPPFPAGSFGMAGRLGETPGYYVNGGIMPLVGGELSRGAFRYGSETYGFDILYRYYDLVNRTGASYLWYHPTGGPGATGPEVLSTDGWGSSAMLAALIEGAAGVEDHGIRYSHVTLSPRWPAAESVGTARGVATDVNSAYVVTRYAASDGYVAYRWEHVQEEDRSFLNLNATGSGDVLHIRLLLPAETDEVRHVMLNGQPVDPVIEQMGTSQYVVLRDIPNGIVQVQVEVHP